MFEITTERLLLRRICPEDAEDIFDIVSDEETTLDEGGFHAFEEMDEEFRDLIRVFCRQERYGIILRSQNKLIGLLVLQREEMLIGEAEAGFVIHRDYRRKGYMTEAMTALLDVYFTHTGLRSVLARCFTYNTASSAMLEKIGFQYEGMEYKAFYHETRGRVDLRCYRMEKKIWKESLRPEISFLTLKENC